MFFTDVKKLLRAIAVQPYRRSFQMMTGVTDKKRLGQTDISVSIAQGNEVVHVVEELVLHNATPATLQQATLIAIIGNFFCTSQPMGSASYILSSKTSLGVTKSSISMFDYRGLTLVIMDIDGT
jgi:hypothetical protein